MEEKVIKKVDNSSYREKFQFLLSINENVICQRYFRINNFDYASVESIELKETMDECVKMIQDDLVSKSRVYMWYTNNDPVKLTGFAKDIDTINTDDVRFLTDNIEGEGVLSNGEYVKKTYFDYASATNVATDYMDEKPADGEFVFKFTFMMDDKILYERVWDANVYPKYIRNGVDLSNSNAIYKDRDPSTLSFSLAIIHHMTVGKPDLVFQIIKNICDNLSTAYSNDYEYTKNEIYKNGIDGDKTYTYSTYNKEFVNGWRNAVSTKSNEYFNHLYPTKGQIDYIERYL